MYERRTKEERGGKELLQSEKEPATAMKVPENWSREELKKLISDTRKLYKYIYINIMCTHFLRVKTLYSKG